MNIIKDKKGMQVRTWVISMLIFTVVFGLFYVASNDFLTSYYADDLIQEEYNESYQRFNEVMGEEESTSFREIFTDLGEGNLLELTGNLFKGFKTAVKAVFLTFSVVDEMMEDFATDYGVPEAVANLIFPFISAVIIIILIFAIISAVNRGPKL
jgi:hypothetical protein